MWAWPVQKGGAEVDEAWLKLKATLIANPQRPHSEWVAGWEMENGKWQVVSGKWVGKPKLSLVNRRWPFSAHP